MHSKEKKNWIFWSNLIFICPAKKAFQPISLLLPARAKTARAAKPMAGESSAESLQSHLSPLWASSSQSLSRGLYHWEREFWGGMALNLFCLWLGWVFSMHLRASKLLQWEAAGEKNTQFFNQQLKQCWLFIMTNYIKAHLVSDTCLFF